MQPVYILYYDPDLPSSEALVESFHLIASEVNGILIEKPCPADHLLDHIDALTKTIVQSVPIFEDRPRCHIYLCGADYPTDQLRPLVPFLSQFDIFLHILSTGGKSPWQITRKS